MTTDSCVISRVRYSLLILRFSIFFIKGVEECCIFIVTYNVSSLNMRILVLNGASQMKLHSVADNYRRFTTNAVVVDSGRLTILAPAVEPV